MILLLFFVALFVSFVIWCCLWDRDDDGNVY